MFLWGSSGSAVGTATGHALGDREVRVLVPVWLRISLIHNVQTGFEAHTASYAMGSQITQLPCSANGSHYKHSHSNQGLALRAVRRYKWCTDEWRENSECVSAWGGTGLQQVVKWSDALTRPLRREHTAHKSRIILFAHLVYVHPPVIKMGYVLKHSTPSNVDLVDNMTVAQVSKIFFTSQVSTITRRWTLCWTTLIQSTHLKSL
jgi:hypothetical protein